MSDGEEARTTAREAALRLLASRARTETEMRRRLRRKEFSAPVVEDVMAWLRERDYLDDAAFCREFLRERLRRRPRGRFALVQELRKRGVARDLAERMVEKVFDEEGIDEAAAARDAARTWLGRQSDHDRRILAAGDPAGDASTLRRRLYAYLERRGFPRALARRTLDRAVAELDPEAEG